MAHFQWRNASPKEVQNLRALFDAWGCPQPSPHAAFYYGDWLQVSGDYDSPWAVVFVDIGHWPHLLSPYIILIGENSQPHIFQSPIPSVGGVLSFALLNLADASAIPLISRSVSILRNLFHPSAMATMSGLIEDHQRILAHVESMIVHTGRIDRVTPDRIVEWVEVAYTKNLWETPGLTDAFRDEYQWSKEATDNMPGDLLQALCDPFFRRACWAIDWLSHIDSAAAIELGELVLLAGEIGLRDVKVASWHLYDDLRRAALLAGLPARLPAKERIDEVLRGYPVLERRVSSFRHILEDPPWPKWPKGCLVERLGRRVRLEFGLWPEPTPYVLGTTTGAVSVVFNVLNTRAIARTYRLRNYPEVLAGLMGLLASLGGEPRGDAALEFYEALLDHLIEGRFP